MGSTEGRYRTDEDLLDRIAKLEKRISALERTPQLPTSGVNTGGIVVKGGALNFQDANGQTKVYFGPIYYGNTPAGIGWLFYRNGGQLVFSLEGINPSDQFFAIRDKIGNIVISDDRYTGQGLATPYIQGDFVSWAAAIPDSTTSTTFVTLQKSIWRKQHPRFMAWVHTFVTSTTAEFQFKIASGADQGKIIAGPFSLSNGNGYTYYGPVSMPGNHLTDFDLDLEARVVSGAGSIAVRVLSATGVGS